jgi:hypothetical protein
VWAKLSFAVPDVDGAHAGAEQSSHLCHVQHTSRAQSLVSTLELIPFAQGSGDLAIKLHSSSRSHSALVQDCCNLCIRVFIEKMIDPHKNLWRSYAFFPAFQSDQYCQCASKSTIEANVHDDLGPACERHVFDDQRHHAFLFAHRDSGIVPQTREFRGQRHDPATPFFIEHLPVKRTLAFVLQLGFRQQMQLVIPFRLQSVGHQPVLRLHLHVASLRHTRIVGYGKRKQNPLRVAQQVGRLLGKNSQAAGLFHVEVETDTKGWANVRWSKLGERREWMKLSEGCCLLHSNVTDWSGEELWRACIQLTEAEEAFRLHKSDLFMRPVWHHKESREQEHILVCFLAYVLWKTLGQWCQRAGLGDEPRKILAELQQISLVDVVLTTRTGVSIRKQCVSQPTWSARQIL